MKRLALSLWLFALLTLLLSGLLSACGSSEKKEEEIPPDPNALTQGDFTLKRLDDPNGFELWRKDVRLVRLPLSALQLGLVDKIDDKTNYDPHAMIVKDTPFTAPKGLRFVKATSIASFAHTGDVLTITLGFEENLQASLEVTMLAAGRYKLVLKPLASAQAIAYLRLSPKSNATEGYYGLGEYFDSVNHRGKYRDMQIELASLESGYNEAHVPVPFVVGTSGWGFFVNNPYPAVFDCGVTEPETVEATFGTGAASASGVEFYLFAAENPLDLTKHYYEVAGYPAQPARWALGPWIWRDELDTGAADAQQAQALSDMETIRSLDLATTGYWIDRPYASGVNSFDFNPAQFSDPQAMINRAHALGFRMGLWHTPYVSNSHTKEYCEKTIALDAEAKEKGYYPPDAGISLNKWGTIIDYTNPDAYAWWLGLLGTYKAMGIEGYKLDYAEDVVPGILGARNRFLFDDGSDERTMHAYYPKLYHQVYKDTLPADGGFLLCRGGGLGDHVNGCIIWPGDLDADMTLHGTPMTGDDGKAYNAVGGLPASLIAGLTLGISGYPLYGSDTGGYRHSPPSRETFIRWFEQTALSSVMQVGTSSNNVPWEFKDGEGAQDSELLDAYRLFARLHLRLWAYEWTYLQNLKADGRPIMRPLGLARPEMNEHSNDTYFFGDSLLVSPVVESGKTSKRVPFPAGLWQDWFSGATITGGSTQEVAAPLTSLPLYLAEGGIVPLLRPTIDAIAPVTETSVDSYGNVAGLLYARVFPAVTETSFTVFDGTVLKQKKDGATLTLTATSGTEFTQGVVFELIGIGAAKPASVSVAEAADETALAAAASGYIYTADQGGRLLVKLPAGSQNATITF